MRVALRDLRRSLCLNRQALTDKAGVSVQTVYLIETRRVRPRFVVIQAISAALDVDPWKIEEFRASLETPPARRG